MNKVFVYGTLKRGGTDGVLRGFFKDESGPFPTILPSQGNVVYGEVLNVSHAELEAMDRYEGYIPDAEGSSLYVRMQTRDGKHVYVANVEQHGPWESDYTLDEIEEALADAAVLEVD